MMVHIAVPAMNEAEYIEQTLACIQNQQCNADMMVYICVNQPEAYWNNEETMPVCLNNQWTLSMLEKSGMENLTIIDRSSKGLGWDAKKHGVGMARKVLMDFVSEKAKAEDIVISLDSDTLFEPDYVQSIVDRFESYPKAVAVSVPYYHGLTSKEAEDRAILRYEIYMRNYAIQMLRINSPYAFTALGSAMAYRVSAYRAIGGMAPMKSGEDFYFLQQLKKFGTIIISNSRKVYPAARFSNRVFFGTGPAMIKGNSGDWSSYPIYHKSLFQEVDLIYKLIPDMYLEDEATEALFFKFLQTQFKDENFLAPLRKNAKNTAQFVRAFHTKVDGLRVLQFLKSHQVDLNMNDQDLIQENYPEFAPVCKQYPDAVSLEDFSVAHLSEIRDELAQIEGELITETKILS
jgi:glycosyltransferase involved in cell wall biosynthesis